MNTKPPFFILRRAARAFSLVEITLALGIVTFALVGVIGVLPVALSNSRQSFDKNRAMAIANTLFASFRSQPFNKVGYYDEQFDDNGVIKSGANQPLDLNAQTKTSSTVTFYATFLDVSTPTGNSTDPFGTQRRLRFFTQAVSGEADYRIDMNFNNTPDGTEIVNPQAGASNGPPVVPAQANQIEMIISPTGRPKDQYRFVSVVSNRTN